MEKALNGQFREFIGKLLVKGNDEYVAKIDKTKIQNGINSLSSKEDMVFENFIRFINNGCNIQVIGNHEIDTNATPALPFNGATIEYHKKDGKMILDFSKINFYLSESQKTGSLGGHKLRGELKGKKVLNACVLDYLLTNPHLIPEDWKKDASGNTRFIFFWGTIFRYSVGNLCVRLYVRCLHFNGGGWRTYCPCLNGDFGVVQTNTAAVYAS